MDRVRKSFLCARASSFSTKKGWDKIQMPVVFTLHFACATKWFLVHPNTTSVSHQPISLAGSVYSQLHHIQLMFLAWIQTSGTYTHYNMRMVRDTELPGSARPSTEKHRCASGTSQYPFAPRRVTALSGQVNNLPQQSGSLQHQCSFAPKSS